MPVGGSGRGEVAMTGEYQIPRGLRDRLIREGVEAHRAMGMGEAEARQIAVEMLETAIERAREEGTLDLPPGMGDEIFAKADSVPQYRQMIDSRLAEGATEEECRWWWNLPEVERQLLKVQDDTARYACSRYDREQGRSEEEAWARVRKTFAMYGSIDAVAQESGDDRPLPYELKNRINRWLAEVVAQRPDEFKRRAGEFPTLNAFIRAEMRAGRLAATQPEREGTLGGGASAVGRGCLLSVVAVLEAVVRGR